MRWIETIAVVGAALCVNAASGQSFNLMLTNPPVDRWMYAFNFSPGSRPAASVFGTSGDSAGVDTRHAQYLLGFDTASQIETNRGATNYLIRRARLTLTASVPDETYQFRYDPTHDAVNTYAPTNEPGYAPDGDIGRPIELFGAGFRNGFTDGSFAQTSPFGSNAPGQRNAFAAGYSTNGNLVDVGNNTGKTNAAFPHFEVHPFAVGQTADFASGDLVTADCRFAFELDLSDPLVRQYLQESLNTGRLRLMVSSLHDTGGEMSATGFPNFHTHFSAFSNFGYGPVLELEATAIRPDDTDSDGLPDDWERFYFNTNFNLLNQAADDDSDNDGQPNLAEYRSGTNPSDASDRLHIVSSSRTGDGTFHLDFSHAPSRHYAIEFSSDLQDWSSIETPALIYYSTTGAVQWRDDGSLTGGFTPARYYRVRTK